MQKSLAWLNGKRRMHGAPRRVLVRDRCSEQRHEPVAAVLIDGAFEAVNFGGDQLEAALNDAMDLLRISCVLS